MQLKEYQNNISAAYDGNGKLIKGLWNNYPEQAALEAITINPALIANVSDRVGSLKKGKDADFVIIDGHWYEPKSRIVKVYINGMEVFDRSTIEK